MEAFLEAIPWERANEIVKQKIIKLNQALQLVKLKIKEDEGKKLLTKVKLIQKGVGVVQGISGVELKEETKVMRNMNMVWKDLVFLTCNRKGNVMRICWKGKQFQKRELGVTLICLNRS